MATLIYYDESAHKIAQREATDVAARFTEVLKLYQALNLAPAVAADLPALVANPAEWVLSKYTDGQSFQFAGLTLDPKKVLDLMGDLRPAGFNEFVQAATWLGEDLGVLQIPFQSQAYNPQREAARHLDPRPGYPGWTNYVAKQAAQYTVVGGWEVKLSKQGAERLESLYKSYATTSKQKEILVALNAVCEALNKLPEGVLRRDSGLLGQGSLANAVELPNYGEAPARPNPQFILRYQ